METASRYLQLWLEKSDLVTGAPMVMETGHYNVHEGLAFSAEYAVPVLANGGTARFVLTTGTAYPHFVFGLDVGGAVRAYFYEGSTYTGGTVVPAYNYNRLSTKTASMTVYHTPTAGTAGTVALVNGRYIAGGESQQTRVGGGLRTSNEFILDVQTVYMLDIVNVSGGNIVAGAVFDWYEEIAYD